MILTKEEKKMLSGEKGETYRKVFRTVVMFGDVFGAERLIDVTHPIHIVTSSIGGILLKPLYDIMDELIENGIKTKEPFTVDPRPYDHKNIECTDEEMEVFNELYNIQDAYENQLVKVGLKDENAYTCTCYFEEVGNIPKCGDILSWAESSAVVYANSVLGARSNRNSGIMEMFGGIIGKVPYYGLLTDEGRKADWIIEIKTSKIPEAQILGSAIGLKVVENVPYIKGLDRFIGEELNLENKGYLKDMGAATASNGAVGLFHVDNLTPEAKEQGEDLIREDAKIYTIDDKELQRVYDGYPVMWKDESAEPYMCFLGCPHLDYTQLVNWTHKIVETLKMNNLGRVGVKTVLATAPDVIDRFKKTPEYKILIGTGAILSDVCPLMFVNNPLIDAKPIITNSNKLRTYTNAKYHIDDEIIEMICCNGGENE
jgi:hypothetical protein